MSSAPVRDISWLEAILNRLPVGLALVELGTGAILSFNRSALRIVGEAPEMPQSLEEYVPGTLFDAHGREIGIGESPPARVARGERFAFTPIEWNGPDGRRVLLVTGDQIELPDGEIVGIIAFEDITELRQAERGAEQSREDLNAILDGVADAVTAQGPTGELLYANQAAVDMLGYDSAEQLLSAPLDEIRDRFVMLDAARRPLPIESLPGRRALLGEDPEPVVVRYRPARGGPEGWSRVKARPIRDETGTVRMAINVIEDITEIKQAEHAQRFLAAAGRVLASSLDYERTLRSVAELAVPEIADWCVVDLATEEGFERVAVAHADPAKLALADTYSRRYPPDPTAPTGVPQVLRTGRPELYPELTPELLAANARDEEHLELILSLGMTSVMIVPMVGRDHVVGAITMIAAESGRHYSERDLSLAMEAGRQAGMAVENARLYRQRSDIARTLQASLLPPELPEIERLDTAAAFRAAGEGFEVGGDFYDLFSTAEHQWFAVIGDVCGKGAEAAATTALVRYTVRAAAVRRRSPASILRWLNDAMLRQRTGPMRFCTLAVVRLDLDDAGIRVTAACAGHPLPRIVRAGGGVERVGRPGTLAGVTPDVVVDESSTSLESGDTLVLFTDGLTEARAPERVWSPEDVEEALADVAGRCGPGVEDLVDGIVAEALVEIEAPTRDDLAVLALRAR